MCPVVSVFGYSVPTFSVFVFAACTICFALYLGQNIRKPANETVRFLKSLILVMVFAAFGARLLSAVTLSLQGVGSIIYCFVYGGAVFWGGIAGGVFALLIVSRGDLKQFLDYSDTIAIYLPLGQAIGRIGCFFNGCCYGCPYLGFLSVKYPINGDITSIFPTWFVESGFCLILFVFLLLQNNKSTGHKTGVYLLSYAVFRFFLEFLRGDDVRGVWGLFSTSQLICPLFMIFGVLLLVPSINKFLHSASMSKE